MGASLNLPADVCDVIMSLLGVQVSIVVTDNPYTMTRVYRGCSQVCWKAKKNYSKTLQASEYANFIVSIPEIVTLKIVLSQGETHEVLTNSKRVMHALPDVSTFVPKFHIVFPHIFPGIVFSSNGLRVMDVTSAELECVKIWLEIVLEERLRSGIKLTLIFPEGELCANKLWKGCYVCKGMGDIALYEQSIARIAPCFVCGLLNRIETIHAHTL